MKARAVAKYIKGSPQKARLVVDLIRGRKVNEALLHQQVDDRFCTIAYARVVSSRR